MYRTDYSSSIMVFAKGEYQAGEFRKEYDACQALLRAQPLYVQQFLENQAHTLATSFLKGNVNSQFNLPEEVVTRSGQLAPTPIPEKKRVQGLNGLIDRIMRVDHLKTITQRLSELERSPDQAIATSAILIRHTLAMYMVRKMIPAGHSVHYSILEGDEISSIPDEVVELIPAGTDKEIDLQVPYVPYARQFYLPQWVAFGSQDELLVSTLAEAEAYLTSMQQFLEVLHVAVALAPYLVVDDHYQQKRYGMLGQLVNQGRAFCRYRTNEIINTIKKRVKAGTMNRGLSLELPYFDDQELVVKKLTFEVIPTGFIMFVPAFIIKAVLEQRARITLDPSLRPSTRRHLMDELRMLGYAFEGNHISE
jgi:hypothetical protein